MAALPLQHLEVRRASPSAASKEGRTYRADLRFFPGVGDEIRVTPLFGPSGSPVPGAVRGSRPGDPAPRDRRAGPPRGTDTAQRSQPAGAPRSRAALRPVRQNGTHHERSALPARGSGRARRRGRRDARPGPRRDARAGRRRCARRPGGEHEALADPGPLGPDRGVRRGRPGRHRRHRVRHLLGAAARRARCGADRRPCRGGLAPVDRRPRRGAVPRRGLQRARHPGEPPPGPGRPDLRPAPARLERRAGDARRAVRGVRRRAPRRGRPAGRHRRHRQPRRRGDLRRPGGGRRGCHRHGRPPQGPSTVPRSPLGSGGHPTPTQ